MRLHCDTLVSVVELGACLNDPNLVVFDCRHDLANPVAGRRLFWFPGPVFKAAPPAAQ